MTGGDVFAEREAAALLLLASKGLDLPPGANTFVKKLFNIVCNEDDGVIAWNEGTTHVFVATSLVFTTGTPAVQCGLAVLLRGFADGDSFTIVDPKLLEAEVLPKYFRHSRYSSLVRQLNFYSFKKITKVTTTKARNFLGQSRKAKLKISLLRGLPIA